MTKQDITQQNKTKQNNTRHSFKSIVMQIDVAYVVVGLIANNTGQLIARQNSTLQYITSNQLLCRRTMVGEVVGLRRSKYTTEHYTTEYNRKTQNIILYQAITFAYQAERITTNITVQQNKVKQK